MSGRMNPKRDEISFQKQNSRKRASIENNRPSTSCRFISPMKFLKHIREKVAKLVLCVAKRTRTSPDADMSSRRSNPSVAPIDSHRNEAINDCIEFINASSSSQKAKPVSATTS